MALYLLSLAPHQSHLLLAPRLKSLGPLLNPNIPAIIDGLPSPKPHQKTKIKSGAKKYFARYATTVLKLCASPLTLAKLDWAETFLGFDEPVFELKNKSMTILVDIAQKHIEAVNRIYDKVYETDTWILFSNIYTSILSF